MVRKKLRKLKRKVQKKRITAEEKQDLNRRVKEQKRLDANRKEERERIARQRRISQNNPDTVGERVAVVKKDASAIANDVKGIARAKAGRDRPGVRNNMEMQDTTTSKVTKTASKFFQSDGDSNLFDSNGSDSDLFDNGRGGSTNTGIDGGGIDPGDFDFGEMGNDELGSFDLNDDDDLFG